MIEMVALIGGILLVGVLLLYVIVKTCYKVCPSDKILIVNGAGSGRKKDAADDTGGAKIYQGGGSFVIPGFQTFNYISLSPLSVNVDLEKTLTANNILVDVPTQITFAIDTESVATMRKAVKQFSSFTSDQIRATASNAIVGSMRSVIASMTVEDLITNRDKFYSLVDETLTAELAKLGLKLINRNIVDIKDHNNYIRSLGMKASEQVSQQAAIDVAEQRKLGEIGTAERVRDQQIAVNEAKSTQAIRTAQIQKDQDTQTAQANAERVVGIEKTKTEEQIGVSSAQRAAEIATSQLTAEAAEKSRDFKIRTATANQESTVAEIDALRVINEASVAQRIAELSIDQIAITEVQRKQQIIIAEGAAAQTMIDAKAKADAILLQYAAEAEGQKLVLIARAEGYERMVAAAGSAVNAGNLLLLEQMPEIARIQVEALKGIKIDQIMLYGGGSDGQSPISNLVQDFVSSLPAANQFMKNAGITIPAFLGGTSDDKPQQ